MIGMVAQNALSPKTIVPIILEIFSWSKTFADRPRRSLKGDARDPSRVKILVVVLIRWIMCCFMTFK